MKFLNACPTCPKDVKYDDYRNSKQEFGYDSEVGVFNSDMAVTINSGQDHGIGFNLGGGAGLMMEGLEFSIGGWSGGPGTRGQVYFMMGAPNNPFYMNASASAQLTFVHSTNGREIDLSGNGTNAGLGVGPASLSYGKGLDDNGNTTAKVYGAGPGIGVKGFDIKKISGGATKTKTWTIDIYTPFPITPLLTFH